MPVWVFPWALNSRAWALNSAVECHPHTVEVVGSNPTAPTIFASGAGLYGKLYSPCGAFRKLEDRKASSGVNLPYFQQLTVRLLTCIETGQGSFTKGTRETA